MNKRKQSGITLIALVITIIVLLILAGVTIAMLGGNNGTPAKANEASAKDAVASAKDRINLVASDALLDFYNLTYVNDTSVGSTDVKEQAQTAVWNKVKEESNYEGVTLTPNDTKKTITVTSTKDTSVSATCTVKQGGGITWSDSNSGGSTGATASKVTIDGTDVDLSALTASTVKQHYGKTVATVNTVEYGLFYVDYDGKYGDKGTVYLRAKSKIADTQLDSPSKTANSFEIMKQINPDWAKDADRIKAVEKYLDSTKPDPTLAITSAEKGALHLCNPDVSTWSSIKTGFETLCNKNTGDDYVNYVIGAPSVEMFLDSYNAKYNTTTYSVHFKAAGEKKTYPGYLYSNDGGTNNFSTSASGATQEDTTAGVMYRNSSKAQWLASPLSGNGALRVCNVASNGYLSSDGWSTSNGVAPLVSLKSGVDLTTTN